MKKTISSHDFHDAFLAAGRDKQFSHNALKSLFEYCEEMERDTGEEYELDVVALCCDFAEYATAAEAAQDCGGWGPDEDEDEEAQEESALEYLEGETQVIKFDGGIIVQQF